MTTLLAYHNDPKIKAKYLRRVRAHRRADELVQGTGWVDGNGCAVGCTLNNYDHSLYPTELGVPEILARLEDRLFELIPRSNKEAWLAWPERFLSAIKPGADLIGVWGRWAVWMLVDEEHGVIRRAKGRPDCEAAIRRVAELWRTGGTPEEFMQARTAAYAYAAAAAADAYAYAAAAYAYAAADAAAYAADAGAAAAYAAADAADAADASAASAADAAYAGGRARWVTAACDKLIELLESAPIGATP